MYISPGLYNKLAMENSIPIGSILECNYYYNGFIYTTYNGVSGWIIDMATGATYDYPGNKDRGVYSKVAQFENNQSSEIIIKNAPFYEKPIDNADVIGYIPQNTEFVALYWYGYFTAEKTGYIGFIYNNQLGWISCDDCAFKIEPCSQILEFEKDLIIDNEVVISSGEIVELFCEYYSNTFDGGGNYYSYNGYNFTDKDLVDAYELNNYIIFGESYKDLPINEKLELKLPLEFTRIFAGAEKYVAYNGKKYIVSYLGEDYKYVTIDENYYYIQRAERDFDLLVSPFDNTVVTTVHSGDIVYCTDSVDIQNRYSNYSYFITLNGEEGFAKYSDYKSSVIASNISKENIQEYLDKIVIESIDSKEQNTQSGEEIIEESGNRKNNGEGIIEESSSKDNSGESVVEGIISENSSGENVINIFDIQNQKRENAQINMAILCICGSGILALTAVVTIILVNKKHKEINNKSRIIENNVNCQETSTQNEEEENDMSTN